MKYFLDTEFHEGFYKPMFGKQIHFIDLISIGIVCEDGREYYAISKDFNFEAAWNSYDVKTDFGKPRGLGDKKVYWLQENVLNSKMELDILNRYSHGFNDRSKDIDEMEGMGLKAALKYLIQKYGKTNEQIAYEVARFARPEANDLPHGNKARESEPMRQKIYGNPEFYAYYADYDWVVLCSLFGKMVNLPQGFPMYCRDLKQMLDSHFSVTAEMIDYCKEELKLEGKYPSIQHLSEVFHNDKLKKRDDYPKHSGSIHNALADAKWNMELYFFLTKKI